MGRRAFARRASAIATPLAALLGTGTAAASGPTDLQQISPLIWVMIAISVGGALITFAILFYALWRYRDPATKGRRYG